jgi:hypothetical protein
VERSSFHDRLVIVEARSLHFALRAPVETTEMAYAILLSLVRHPRRAEALLHRR